MPSLPIETRALAGRAAGPVAWALALALAAPSVRAAPSTASEAPPAPAAPAALRPVTELAPAPDAAQARERPVVVQARELQAQPGREVVAQGQVELRRADLLLRADQLRYDAVRDLAQASGQVEVRREGSVIRAPQAQLQLQRFEGWFLEPEFEFLATGARGRAQRVDILGEQRLTAADAAYTSCPRDGSNDPAWLLSARRLELDFTRNEGVAQGAVLQFLGVPILALPSMSFPVTGARKSGWLPPSVNLDNRSGLDLSVPWYWNIAPNRDATIAPRLSTRRGAGLDAEFRYLEPAFDGELAGRWLPRDEAEGRSRHALRLQHDARLAAFAGHRGGDMRLHAALERVSDDAWWRDFPRSTAALTPRLLPLHASLEQPLELVGGEGLAYLRTTRWQVLQSQQAPIVAPYDREVQLGARLAHGGSSGWEGRLEAELNRFVPADGQASSSRPNAWRAHAVGTLARPWRQPGWWVVPRLGVNAASYELEQPLADGRRRFARTIPTLSLDMGLELERELGAFGRAWRQTLEPRLLAVYTPYRAQQAALAFDSAAKDFSFSSIFSDNDFSGVDLVSDARQLNAGFTTRLVDAQGGRELLRLGMVQRYLLAEQRVTVEGAPLTQRFSDVLLLGSTSAVPSWFFEGSMRYSPDIRRPVRSLVSARYTPGDFRTVSATYRFSRGSSEQLEFGVQWPLARLGTSPPDAAAGPGGVGGAGGATLAPAGRCSGRLYGVGRVNYSVRDSRVTDSILGLEFDAGCWIGRIVVERQSTGRTEATTRLMLQLELVGLSRLGSNPLRVLKDNIPGYQLLRDERGSSSFADSP